jgi:peptidoglycan/xylan/chitin deacetylase (PgdA/CDA1 family)
MKLFKKKIIKGFYFIGSTNISEMIVRPWRGQGAVLMYHRVLSDSIVEKDVSPLSGLAISETLFKKQMNYLKKKYKIVSMDQMAEHLLSPSKEFVVAITFDDGYKDNLTHALPILELYNIPATIYITTRFPQGDTSLWWYELWDYLLIVDKIEIVYGNLLRSWNTTSHKDKITCYQELISLVMPLPYHDQLILLNIITNKSLRKQYIELCLNWKDIQFLDKHDLITIGAHTHTHPNLSSLSEKEAFNDMFNSKEILEKELMHPILHFAYPFGKEDTTKQRELMLAQQCGFITAVTNQNNQLYAPNMYEIPRIYIGQSEDLRDFKTKLSGFELLMRKVFSK